MSKLPAYDVLVLGAGAAGLMCAAVAAQRGRRVLLVDKANKPGKKILISGGGRCNFTNMHTEPSRYLSQNPHFCKSALARYTPWDFMALMEKHQLSWHEKTLGQLFCDQKSTAVVNMLVSECTNAGVKIVSNTELEQISPVEDGFEIQTDHQSVQVQSLVVATGGPSIPRMGSTDFGLQVARQFGLKSIPFAPALVPFTFSRNDLEGMLADLAGVSVAVRVDCGGITFRENMLFTHRGLSGPAILQISSYWQQGEQIQIDLYPDGNLSTWLQEQQAGRPKAELKTVLRTLYPKRLVQHLCDQVVPVANRAIQQYSTDELTKIAEALQQWALTPAGTEGMRTAEVASGGVDTQELSSKTFEAHKVPGLYFIGETVDVTGWLGGYNFQWAWASGWCAGQYV